MLSLTLADTIEIYIFGDSYNNGLQVLMVPSHSVLKRGLKLSDMGLLIWGSDPSDLWQRSLARTSVMTLSMANLALSKL